MTIDPDIRDLFDGCNPVAAHAWDYPPGHHITPHMHSRAQLVHAVSGVMTVTTPQGSWVVPPLRGVWVPAGTVHSIGISGTVRMRTLFIAPDLAAQNALPDYCTVVEVTELLRAIILRATEMPSDYDWNGPGGRLMTVALDEIRTLPALPLHVPHPQSQRLSDLCRAVLADLSDTSSVQDWAKRFAMSGRTLERQFLRETGLSLGEWRRRARLTEALRRLAEGQPILTVALDLGYANPSAFSAMFHRALGVAPSRYFSGSLVTRGDDAADGGGG